LIKEDSSLEVSTSEGVIEIHHCLTNQKEKQEKEWSETLEGFKFCNYFDCIFF